jgi:hypothetical protein
MSKAINVQTGHYKVAGRGRQGEGLLQEQQKRAYAGQREAIRTEAAQEHAGVPVWESTPPKLVDEDERRARSRKRAGAKRGGRKSVRRKTGAKAKPTRRPAKGTARRSSVTGRGVRRGPARRGARKR